MLPYPPAQWTLVLVPLGRYLQLTVLYVLACVLVTFVAAYIWQVLTNATSGSSSHVTHFQTISAAFRLTGRLLVQAARLVLSVTPLVWLQMLAAWCVSFVKGAVETAVSAGSTRLLGERDLTPRNSFSINGKIMVGMFTVYFLRPTIQMVIETSKMNYRITRVIRRTGQKMTYFLQMLLVLPLSFLQMFDLFTIMFDTFLAIFRIFFKVIEIGFYYAILIFRTYKIFVLCCTSIMTSVYITAFYSILLVHSGLTCLKAFTALLQHSTVRQALISYKEHKRRARRLSSG